MGRRGWTSNRGITLLVVACLWLIGCSAGPTIAASTRPTSTPKAATTGAIKHVTAAIMGEPRTLRNTVNGVGGAGEAPGLDTLQELLHVGMVTADSRGRLEARLADVVPSLDNGLWKLFPDGSMAITWRIRPDARWHDGEPVSAADLVFTATVAQDRELAIFRDVAFDAIESVDVIDPRTVVVRWSRPYIDADQLFGYGTGVSSTPLPVHLLGAAYTQDKASFALQDYWADAFVGAGPFKLRSFHSGSHVILDANDSYVLGRPLLDEIEVRFITDPNSLMASLLSGAVELTLGRNLSLEQGLQMRSQWRDGRVETAGAARWMAIFPQFLNPDPAIVSDVRFRRAMLQAIDRQALVDSVQSGLGAVADSIVTPDIPENRDVDRNVVRYPYDPRIAADLLQELGYTRQSDGLLRDASNRRIPIELRTVHETHNEEALFPVADAWKRAGIDVDPVVIPSHRVGDRPYRATFPAFEILGQPEDVRALMRLRVGAIPLPETGYSGSNRTRYMNPELESMLDRYFSTIPKVQRAEALGQVVHHITDQLVWIGLYHEVTPAFIGRRLIDVGPPVLGPTQARNAHEWDVRT